jgi:hypothetical protein
MGVEARVVLFIVHYLLCRNVCLVSFSQYLLLHIVLALRYSHRGRVTFFLQQKKVTKNAATTADAPQKDAGFPFIAQGYHAVK